MEAYSRGRGLLDEGFKIFLVVGPIPVEIFLIMNYFFDARHASNRITFSEQAKFR